MPGRILILEGYTAGDESPRRHHVSRRNSPAARAAKACRRLAKGKGIMAPRYRACVKKYIRKHKKHSRRSR